MKDLNFDTKAIREGYRTTGEQEHSEAIFLTSSFTYDSAEQAAKRFSKEEPGNIYARFTNPTVDAFERKLAALEGAEACVATSSGMAAIFATLMALLNLVIILSHHAICLALQSYCLIPLSLNLRLALLLSTFRI